MPNNLTQTLTTAEIEALTQAVYAQYMRTEGLITQLRRNHA